MDKVFLVYNPFSGQRSMGGRLDLIIEKFAEAGEMIVPFRFFDPEHLPFIKDHLNKEEYKYMVICGGDGTVNKIANLLIKENIPIPFGVIPAGTCNDFARSIGMGADIRKNIDIILQKNITHVDVGLVNGETYFLNTCAGGILVDISFSTHRDLKMKFGTFAYYFKALSELGNSRHFDLELTTEQETIKTQALMFIILNGKHVAGFHNFAKTADYSDGLMDIIIIKNCWHIDLAGMIIKVLAQEISKDKNIISLKAKKCFINGNENIALTLDGEKGPKLPLTIDFFSDMIRVFVKKT